MAVSIYIEKKFKDFSLQVQIEGTTGTMGILGASGSGKSMTLKCVAGIETPDRGRIVINGNTVFDSEKGINQKPQERRIGYLFQNYALFPTMTVKKNIACGYRGKRQECQTRVKDYISRYRLEGLEKRYPAQLSGGQQQRVALARMMIGEPQMILLDEPFSALDGYLKDILQRDMQDFLKDYKGDMMLVTHSRDEAYKFCSQLTLLKEGKNLTAGFTKDIFENPGLLEAARLTGCKNFSEIQRLDDHHVYAMDWDVILHTRAEVPLECTHIGIRGHWIQSVQERKDNCISVKVMEYIENPFEHQYLVKNASSDETVPIWWMCTKSSFQEDRQSHLPKYLYFPPEHIMILNENVCGQGTYIAKE